MLPACHAQGLLHWLSIALFEVPVLRQAQLAAMKGDADKNCKFYFCRTSSVHGSKTKS